jgi:phage N-6-adenine-methyltransferase
MSLTKKVMASKPRHPNYDEWETPPALFYMYDRQYDFKLDVCASATNAKVPSFFTKEMDGLSKDWIAPAVWMNPPYSNIGVWIKKALDEIEKGNCEVVVALLPVWTDTYWFQQLIDKSKAEFLPYKVKFLNSQRKVVGSPTFCSFIYPFTLQDVPELSETLDYASTEDETEDEDTSEEEGVIMTLKE